MAVDQLQVVSSTPKAQDITALRQVFESISAESCPTAFNFHMHTVFSDGRLQPEALAQQAIVIGLQGFAITDHHSVDGYRAAQRWFDEQPSDRSLPHFWTGVEVTSSLLNIEVHILGYGFDPNAASMQPYLQRQAPEGGEAAAEVVIDALHRAGGLVVLAHPMRYRRSPEELIHEAVQLGIDGVETFYAYDNPTPWRPSPKQTQKVAALSRSYGLLNTCGSDTHGLSLLQRL